MCPCYQHLVDIVVDKQYCFKGKFSGKNRVGAIFIIVTSYRIYYKQQIKRDARRLSMKTGAFFFFLLTKKRNATPAKTTPAGVASDSRPERNLSNENPHRTQIIPTDNNLVRRGKT
jgi:hypothetical protein